MDPAVATIVSRERRFVAGARIGLLWGVGHTVTLAVVGTLVVTLNTGVPALRLREALRGIVAVAPDRRLADHHHGDHEKGVWGSSAVWPPRSVVHVHDGAPHVHPSAALLAAWREENRRVGLRALLVGAVHGMAGTAAIALLVLATLHTVAAAAIYMLVFGLGTIVGMTALTAAMAYPVVRLARLQWMRAAMAVTSGLAAIVFGCWYAARLV